MTNANQDIAAILAPLLGGTITPNGTNEIGNDFAGIDFASGLRIVVRSGFGADRNKFRFGGSYTKELRGDLDYREMPALHELTTSADKSRNAGAMARQIQTRIIEPAAPLLEVFRNKREAVAAHLNTLEELAKRWQARFPTAKIEFSRDNRNVEVRFRGGYGGAGLGWYIDGRLNANGGLYIDRMSSLPEEVAAEMISGLIARGSN